MHPALAHTVIPRNISSRADIVEEEIQQNAFSTDIDIPDEPVPEPVPEEPAPVPADEDEDF